MKTKIFAIFAIASMLATVAPVMAATDVQSILETSGSYTNFNMYASVAGYDWTEQSYQTTAYLKEEIVNDGNIQVWTNIETSEWIMQESQQVVGAGDTDIDKYVAWWTEDSRTECGPDCTPVMMYPTETSIYTYFGTDTTTIANEIFNVADNTTEGTDGQFSESAYWESTTTDEPFLYKEGVSIGTILDCSVISPDMPKMPNCESGICE